MTIITHGIIEKEKYRANCPICNCYFKYSADDVVWTEGEAEVACPECGRKIPAIELNVEQKLEK